MLSWENKMIGACKYACFGVCVHFGDGAGGNDKLLLMLKKQLRIRPGLQIVEVEIDSVPPALTCVQEVYFVLRVEISNLANSDCL